MAFRREARRGIVETAMDRNGLDLSRQKEIEKNL